MNLKLYFTKSQYLKFDMNISSFVSSTLMHNSFFLLGSHYFNCFINLNITISKIKFVFSILNKYSKVNYSSYFVINIIENVNMIKFYKKSLKKFNLNFYLGRWKNGLLNNFARRLPFMHDYINLVMKKIRLPNFIFLVDYKEIKDGIDKVSPLNLEFFRISANSMILSQASTNFNKATDIILLNIKGIFSNLFLMNFIFVVIKKFLNLKKFFFLKKIIKNKTVFNNYLVSKKKSIIYAYVNLKFNRSRFYKLKAWKNGLI